MTLINLSNITNWILVTGVIRSGTTFAGKVLSLPIEVDYLHEPFNGGRSLPDREPLVPQYVRPGVNGEDVSEYHRQLSQIFKFNISLKTSSTDRDPWYLRVSKKFVGSRGPFYLRLARSNPFHKAAIIKDPTSKMVAEYLYLNFGVKPVVIVRHPVSLVASLKRVGWWPGVEEYAASPDLAADFFSDEMEFLNRNWSDPLLKSAAHWRASYKFLLAQAAKYPDWHIVTHEAMSADPINVFERLYESLDLPWSSSVRKKIERMTQKGSAEAKNGRVMDLTRNSSEIFKLRRDSLSIEERRSIFEVVKDVALDIYPRNTFAID